MPIDAYLAAMKGGGEKTPAVDRYAMWGKESSAAQQEGWYPTEWNNDHTIYRNKYDNAFNIVNIPGQNAHGHIAAIGKKNGMFDLVIRDAGGNVKQVLKQDIQPAQVRSWIVQPNSTIAQRTSSVVSGNNQDKYNSEGGYTAPFQRK